MESFEAFTQRSKEDHERLHTMDRQIYDTIQDIDHLIHPRVTISGETTVHDMRKYAERFTYLVSDYIEALKPRASEDMKLEAEIEAFAGKAKNMEMTINELARKGSLDDIDAAHWDKEKDLFQQEIYTVHMLITGTAGNIAMARTMNDSKN